MASARALTDESRIVVASGDPTTSDHGQRCGSLMPGVTHPTLWLQKLSESRVAGWGGLETMGNLVRRNAVLYY